MFTAKSTPSVKALRLRHKKSYFVADSYSKRKMSENNSITVLFQINGKTVKIRVKTKDARKQLRVGEFKNFVFQKCKPHFNDELANYVWKVYNKELKKYLWANDNVLINDNDKVTAAIKENMTMLVINPNNLSRNGSEERLTRYEVEIKERKSKKNETGNLVSDKDDVASPSTKEKNASVPTKRSQFKQHLSSLAKESCSNEIDVQSPTNSVTMVTPICSPKNKEPNGSSPGKHIDVKPLLISLVKKYNQEFSWISKNSGAVNFDDDNFDGVWDLIAGEMNNKLSFYNHEYTYEECKEQFGLLLSLYISIIEMENAKRIEEWQFFKIFHFELDLTPFVENIEKLKANFDRVSAVEKKI